MSTRSLMYRRFTVSDDRQMNGQVDENSDGQSDMQSDGQAAPLLTLTANIDPEGHAAATIPVGWCITPALIQRLKEGRYSNPHLLLVIRNVRQATAGNVDYPSPDETGHYLVPLTQELVYVTFTRPGANEVIPVIVDIDDRDSARAAHGLGRPGSTASLTMDGNPWTRNENWGELAWIDPELRLEVYVLPEMFAAEPKPWMSSLVGRFYEGGAGYDQCHFRRRLITSLLTVAPFVVLGTVFKLLTLVAGLLLTRRRYNLYHLAHPFHGEWLGVWEDVSFEHDHTYWWHDKHGNRRPWPFWVYNHVTFLLLPVAVFVIFNFPVHYTGSDETRPWIALGLWETYLWVDGLLLALGFVMGFLAIVFCGIQWLFHQLKGVARLDSKRKAAQRSAEERQLMHLHSELQTMVCDGTPSASSLKSLPRSKQTLVLLFSELKSRVCRPFAR